MLYKNFTCSFVCVPNNLINPYVDIVGTVYHLVIYMQSTKIHKVFQ